MEPRARRAAAVTAAITVVAVGAPDAGRFWVLLGAALASWTVAELIWSWYELIMQREVPLPSWADIGYLAAAPLAVLALLAHPASSRRPLRHGQLLLDAVSAAVAVALLGWGLVIHQVWRDSDLGTAGGLVSIAYPLTDVVVVVVLVVTMMRSGSSHRWALGWVLAGLLAMSVADGGHTWLEQNGRYLSGDLLDVGWVAAYVAVAVGAYADVTASGSRNGRADRHTPAAADHTPVAGLTPYLPVLVALAVTAGRVEDLDATAWWLAVLLVLLVMARTVLVWVDHASDRRPVRAGSVR